MASTSRKITLAPYGKGKDKGAAQKKSVKIFKAAGEKAVQAGKATANAFKDLGHSIEKRLGIDTPEGRAQVKAEIKVKCKAAADMTKTGAVYGAGVAKQHGKAFVTFAKGVKDSFIASRQDFKKHYLAYLEANAEHNDMAKTKLETLQAKEAYKEAKAAAKAAKNAYRTSSMGGARKMWESAMDRFGWGDIHKVDTPVATESVAEEKVSPAVPERVRQLIDNVPESTQEETAVFSPDSVLGRSAAQAKDVTAEPSHAEPVSAELNTDATVTNLSEISQKLNAASSRDMQAMISEFRQSMQDFDDYLKDMKAKLAAMRADTKLRERLDAFQSSVAVPATEHAVEAEAAL